MTPFALLALIALAIAAAWWAVRPKGLPPGIAASNGRIEATETDIAAKIPGRIVEVLKREGDFVQPGVALARMVTHGHAWSRKCCWRGGPKYTIGLLIG